MIRLRSREARAFTRRHGDACAACGNTGATVRLNGFRYHRACRSQTRAARGGGNAPATPAIRMPACERCGTRGALKSSRAGLVCIGGCS